MSDLFNNLFIFEMANNHQGDVKHGLRIIQAMGKIARKYKVTGAIKFQYRELDTFIHPDYVTRSDVKHIPRFLSTRLTKDQFARLAQAARDEGLLIVVTPFDEPSVQLCLEHRADILKVASCSVTDWPLLAAIANTGKPVIASTGGATLQDIDKMVSFFTHRQVSLAVLHCVSLYPTPNDNLHLGFIERLRYRYPHLTIGYSGHEAPDNLDVVKVAVAAGAKILERHVGVETDTIKLNAYSMTPDQTDAWVNSALIARTIFGNDGEKLITQAEVDSLLSLQRGVYARCAIPKGSTITPENVYFAMPCQAGQLTSGQLGQYRTQWTASKDYESNEAIFEERSGRDTIGVIREMIHEAKGLLGEARIVFGSQYEIELSHHYGMENFRQTGALIVNLINREYCKKLVIMLPQQRHPNHRHRIKEETFHLLWGDLEITLNDRVIHMQAGDMLLIERGAWHSFTTKRGAIIEEVSTTHIKGDSEYEDEAISQKDILERKTILEDW
ncbi:MAG: N-acetylneuraminate synthase family protein [Anaerolineae bacterium]|nr:N-acetylneuraminate synthase family protein [Anaerolineae bacterium]